MCRRRESIDVEDLFIAHVSGMDVLAHGLRVAAKIIEVSLSVLEAPSLTTLTRNFLERGVSCLSCMVEPKLHCTKLCGDGVRNYLESRQNQRGFSFGGVR
jgi:hypothetical protein